MVLILLAVLLLLGIKDYIFEFCMRRYISDKLKADCSIGKAYLGINTVKLENLHLSQGAIDLELTKGEVIFRFPFKLSSIVVSDAAVTIKDFNELPFAVQDNSSAGNNKISFLLGLNNVSVKLNAPGVPELNLEFSLKAAFRKNSLEYVENIDVSEFTLRDNNLSLSGGRLKQAEDSGYTMTISQLIIRDKKIKDISVPLDIGKDSIILVKAPHDFLGEKAYLDGMIDLKDLQRLCIHLNAHDVSFASLADFMGGKDDVELAGLFNGNIDFCWQGPSLSSIKGDFSAAGEGFIHVKKEASLDPLKQRLDEKSYNTLIDNFKNYRYNDAIISIRTEDRVPSLEMHFNSEELGDRDITFNFYDFIGGGK